MTNFRHPDLLAALLHHAETRPNSTALIFLPDGENEGARLTHAELMQRVAAVSSLVAKTAQCGDRVLLIYAPGLEFVIAFLACLHAGVIAVPSSSPSRGSGMARLQGIVADCEPKAILADSESARFLRKASISEKVIVTDETGVNRVQNVTPKNTDPDTIAFLQYTSGSTGTPRGVIVTHQNLVANLDLMQSAYGSNEDSVFVSWLPHFHDMGLIGTQLLALYAGGQCAIMPPLKFIQRPARWLSALTRFSATATGSPNFAFDLCCEKIPDSELADFDLSSLYVLFSGSEPIRPETLQRFIDRFESTGLSPNAVSPGYGLAEATLVVTGGRSEPGLKTLAVNRNSLAAGFVSQEEADLQLAGCGRPLEGQSVRIVDPTTGEPIADGEVGEIEAQGPSISPGYWGENIEPTSDRPLRTGDLGVLIRGELYVIGRLKELIIIRGRNYYPDDLEKVVRRCDKRLEPFRSVAFGVPTEKGERLVIMQEVGPRIDTEALGDLAESIRSSLSQELQVAVSSIVFVRLKTIGLTTSGKPMRRASHQAFTDGSLDSIIERFDYPTEEIDDPLPSPPNENDDLEAWTAHFIQERLGVSQVRPSDSLAGLGFDSMGLVRLIDDLEKLTSRSLPIEVFGSGATVESLAPVLSGESRSAQITEPTTTTPQLTQRDQKYWRERLWLNGPRFREIRFPYGSGNSILRSLVQTSWIHQAFCEEIEDLKSVFSDSFPPQELEKIIQQSLLNHLWRRWRRETLLQPANWQRWVRCKGQDNLPEGGVVLICDHSPFRALIWNLELVKDRPTAVIGEFGPDNLRRTGLPSLATAQSEAEVSRTVKRATQLRLAVDTLRNGGVVIIFADEDEGRGGISRKFHGRQRSFRPGFARLASETKSAMIPLTADMDWSGVVTFRFHEPIETTSSTEAGEKEALNHYADFLSDRWNSSPASVDWYILKKHLQLPPA